MARARSSASIHKDQPPSSAYGGMSLVLFASAERGSMLALVVGTRGISADDAILRRPGHARRTRALAAWANARATPDLSEPPAWAKPDPARVDLDLGPHQRGRLDAWQSAVKCY